jgi:hypothetical protein
MSSIADFERSVDAFNLVLREQEINEQMEEEVAEKKKQKKKEMDRYAAIIYVIMMFITIIAMYASTENYKTSSNFNIN